MSFSKVNPSHFSDYVGKTIAGAHAADRGTEEIHGGITTKGPVNQEVLEESPPADSLVLAQDPIPPTGKPTGGEIARTIVKMTAKMTVRMTVKMIARLIAGMTAGMNEGMIVEMIDGEIDGIGGATDPGQLHLAVDVIVDPVGVRAQLTTRRERIVSVETQTLRSADTVVRNVAVNDLID
jgi:hypothetical protein